MYYLSMSDLVLVDKFKEAFSSGDRDKVLDILYENGMDVKRPISSELVQHRNLQNQIVTCVRLVGNERTDKDWRNSGAASITAWVDDEDKGLKEDLLTLSKEGFSDYSKYKTDNYKE